MLFLRRGFPGLVCGLFGGTLLVGGFGNLSLGLAVGAILGTAYTSPCRTQSAGTERLPIAR